ncbi:FHA domain-containing protein [Acidovorax kalamii]|uniref:FHA domain-containing protein n=1 Tax=Acidovorax kalamii TaxID=2004485 RepID=UPI00209172E8|nr:FHA domain-containing protein [Acidovorax kalamii]MCO5358344.1 FHA domain-containing protein [Acidovorax kalamii]
MSTLPTTTTLGLIEAHDRHGALLARAPITRWPVTVGRALDCDLVLDDPFVAPRHLRIDRTVDEHRTVQVEVLETRNGARLQRKRHAQGERFDWPGGTPIDLGHTHITLRLADAPIADEQALPEFPWRTVGTTAALVVLVGAAAMASSWLESRDSSQYLKSLPSVLLMLLLVLSAWSGLWAVANKMFAGRLQFWRHVRIACTVYLASEALRLVANLAAFSFSLEVLSQFASVLGVLVLAWALYAHLATVLPRRRAGLAWTVAAVVMLGVPAWLGAQWLNRMRLTNEMYMSSLFPPSLRVAPAAPVDQLLQDAEALRAKLDRRLKDDGLADEDE